MEGIFNLARQCKESNKNKRQSAINRVLTFSNARAYISANINIKLPTKDSFGRNQNKVGSEI